MDGIGLNLVVGLTIFMLVVGDEST